MEEVVERSSWIVQYIQLLDTADPLFRLIVAGATVAVSLLLILMIRLVVGRHIKGVEEAPQGAVRPLRWQRQELLSSDDMKQLRITLWRTGGWLLTLVFAVWALIGALMLSTWTKAAGVAVIETVFDTLVFIAQGVIDYIPDLITILIIVFLARFTIRLIGSVFDGIGSRRISIPNFYPEWADTSFTIIKLLIIALAAVIIFPYLPGSSSPAFQGISIFIGVLVSLGSTTAVANVIAGVVLTYTRAFKVGDQVEVSGTRGKIIERTMFVTRIQTLKNVIVSVPNSMVLNNQIINYSQNMGQRGLLVHTGITIGYDVPWQTVNELLVAAAGRTDGIEREPEPFVLQTSLDDNYVSYEVNGWVRNPEKLPRIYSNLHANILDEFHGHQVEITSPAYRAMRGAEETTVPEVIPREESDKTDD